MGANPYLKACLSTAIILTTVYTMKSNGKHIRFSSPLSSNSLQPTPSKLPPPSAKLSSHVPQRPSANTETDSQPDQETDQSPDLGIESNSSKKTADMKQIPNGKLRRSPRKSTLRRQTSNKDDTSDPEENIESDDEDEDGSTDESYDGTESKEDEDEDESESVENSNIGETSIAKSATTTTNTRPKLSQTSTAKTNTPTSKLLDKIAELETQLSSVKSNTFRLCYIHTNTNTHIIKK